MKLTRRGLLLTGAAALVPRSNQAAGPSPSLITLSPRPKDLEMPLEAFIDEITPVDHFFVRCHTMIPQIKLPEWKLEIAGLVDHPLTLTLADLKKLPRVEPDVPIPKFHAKTALHDQKELIFVIVLVPCELTLKPCDLDKLIVHAADYSW